MVAASLSAPAAGTIFTSGPNFPSRRAFQVRLQDADVRLLDRFIGHEDGDEHPGREAGRRRGRLLHRKVEDIRAGALELLGEGFPNDDDLVGFGIVKSEGQKRARAQGIHKATRVGLPLRAAPRFAGDDVYDPPFVDRQQDRPGRQIGRDQLKDIFPAIGETHRLRG